MGLSVAVAVGIVLASLLFMHQMARSTRVRSMTGDQEGDHLRDIAVPPGVEVYSIQGSFFFGAVDKLMDVEAAFFKVPRALVLEMSGVLHLDASGLNVLERVRRQCREKGTRLLLAGVHAQPLMALQQAGMDREIGEENLKGDLEEALRAVGKVAAGIEGN